jgi:hypothetical protein
MICVIDRKILQNNWASFSLFPFRQGEKIIDLVREYYGEKIAFYFTFLDYYACSLAIPAIIGVVVFLIQLF